MSIDYIQSPTPTPALFEQMAEEAAELAQACLKYARAMRGENPTPVTMQEALGSVIEEYSDLELCARVLHIEADAETMEAKAERWTRRLREARGVE